MIVIGLRKIEKSKFFKENKSHVVELSEKDLLLLNRLLIKECTEPITTQEDEHLGSLINSTNQMIKDY